MKILDARVDVYTANFGNASRNLEHAKGPLQAARVTLQSSGPDGAAAKIDEALLRATRAQQLASKFSQDANGRAGRGLAVDRRSAAGNALTGARFMRHFLMVAFSSTVTFAIGRRIR